MQTFSEAACVVGLCQCDSLLGGEGVIVYGEWNANIAIKGCLYLGHAAAHTLRTTTVARLQLEGLLSLEPSRPVWTMHSQAVAACCCLQL